MAKKKKGTKKTKKEKELQKPQCFGMYDSEEEDCTDKCVFGGDEDSECAKETLAKQEDEDNNDNDNNDNDNNDNDNDNNDDNNDNDNNDNDNDNNDDDNDNNDDDNDNNDNDNNDNDDDNDDDEDDNDNDDDEDEDEDEEEEEKIKKEKPKKTFKKVNANTIDGGIVPKEYEDVLKKFADDYNLELVHKKSISTYRQGKVVVASIVKTKPTKTGFSFFFNRLTKKTKGMNSIKSAKELGKIIKVREPYDTQMAIEFTGKITGDIKKAIKIAINESGNVAKRRKAKGKELAEKAKAKKENKKKETKKKKGKKSSKKK